MPTIPQKEKQKSDLVTISFQCPKDWKREADKAAIDLDESMRDVCIRAISKYLKIDLPEDMQNAA